MVDTRNSAEKKQIIDLLDRIKEGVDKQLIKSEKDLEKFVRVVPDSERELARLHGGNLRDCVERLALFRR